MGCNDQGMCVCSCSVDFFSCGHLVEDESLTDEAPFASGTDDLDKH